MAKTANATKTATTTTAKAKRATGTTTKAKATSAPAPQATPAPAPMPKCAAAYTAKAKPSIKMLQVIESKGVHPGVGLRKRRWDATKVGMTLAHCAATEGLDHKDVNYWVEHGLVVLRPATDKEIAAAHAPWSVQETAKAASA